MSSNAKAGACEHWESTSPGFYGHCSHASCPNYMDACPRHQDYNAHPEAECTLETAPSAADHAAVHSIVCMHADEDGGGSHMLAPGEKCERKGKR